MPSRTNKPQTVQVLVVGDSGTGKSALVETFVTSAFPEYSFSSAYNTWTHVVDVDGRRVKLNIWDAGSSLKQDLRAMSYPDKHVVLYCYDASREDTLINVVEKWMPEVMHYLPDAPFLLVSCKNDLRRDRRGRSTPSINAHAAVECSAKAAFGVRDVFEQAARLGVEHAKLHSMGGLVESNDDACRLVVRRA